MTSIHHHIKTLLSLYDCVIIPGFGAFIADYCAPMVDEEQTTLPRKDILFNRNLTRNDGLLINALIEERGIEYKEAKLEIDHYVKEINDKLNKREVITIEDIGELLMDDAGFVQFVANENNTCLLDAYGLPPFRLKKIFKKNTNSTGTQEYKFDKTRHVAFRVASFAAIVILILIFATPLTDKSIGDFAGLGFDSTVPILDNNSIKKQPIKADSSVIDTAITDTPFIKDTLKEPNEQLVTPVYYYAIIASLPSEHLAQKYIQTFRYRNDFDHLDIIKGADRYRISAAQFATKDDAIAYVLTLRSKYYKLSDAWVLTEECDLSDGKVKVARKK